MTRRNIKAGYNNRTGFGLDAFSQDELKSIHLATLHVFQNTGIRLEHEEAIEIFAGAGARVEKRNGYAIIKIPNYLVEDCLRNTPKTVTYYGRRLEDDFVADENRLGFTAGFGESVNVIDLDTRQVRSSTKEDLATITRIQDYLDVITIIERAVCSGDQMPATQSIHNYNAMVKNSSKHCFLGFSGGENAKVIIEQAKIAAGGEKV
ncbi:MAG: Trimethylamine methyltransferase MttB, partial [Deltaproteobacteria bacterium]|nr:Trimethylamine methyltransferase MttB [Deltaproteobacteria bacterium]